MLEPDFTFARDVPDSRTKPDMSGCPGQGTWAGETRTDTDTPFRVSVVRSLSGESFKTKSGPEFWKAADTGVSGCLFARGELKDD